MPSLASSVNVIFAAALRIGFRYFAVKLPFFLIGLRVDCLGCFFMGSHGLKNSRETALKVQSKAFFSKDKTKHHLLAVDFRRFKGKISLKAQLPIKRLVGNKKARAVAGRQGCRSFFYPSGMSVGKKMNAPEGLDLDGRWRAYLCLQAV